MKLSSIKLIIFLFLSTFIILSGTSCSSTDSAPEDDDVMMALEEEDTSGDEDLDGDEEEDIAEETDEADEFDNEDEDEDEDQEVADEDLEDIEEDDDEITDEDFEDEEGDDEQMVADQESEETQQEAQDAAEPVDDQIDDGFQDQTYDEPGGSLSQIQNIKFLSNQNGGTVVVDVDGPVETSSRLNEQTNQFIIEIAGANLPDRLKNPFIMKEFQNTQFGALDAYQKEGSTTATIVVQLKPNVASPSVQQEGNSIIIIPSEETMVAEADIPEEGMGAMEAEPELEPEPELDPEPEMTQEDANAASFNVAEAEKDEKILGARTLDDFLMGHNKFYGRPISIQYKDVDVREAIDFIASESGANLIVSDDVQGRVTLKLREVPWDQALVVLMRAKGLGYIRQGSVLRISKLEQLKLEADNARQIIIAQKNLAPQKVRVIPVSYSKVEDLETRIKVFLTPGRGNAVSDSRTSSIIITDTDDIITKIAGLIKELDVPPAQVMIEGKIVEATEEFQKNIGINWGFLGAPKEISPDGGVNGGPLTLTSNLAFQPVSPNTIDGASSVFDLNVGTLDFLGDLSATIALEESENTAKVISSPRIVTLNKEKATIAQKGEIISITTTIDNGTVTRSTKRTPLELKLEVEPQITFSGSVILEVTVRRQFAGAIVDEETNARPVNTREATTKVMVENGQTAVIGGVYQSDNVEAVRGTPWLKDIPVLGWLFKNANETRIKNELLIFLTPRILKMKDQAIEG